MAAPRSDTPEPIDGVARAILRGGEAAVDTERGAVLVRGLLPGERARLTDVRKSGGALRARVVERLSDSADRVTPPCPVQAQCGGCPLMIWNIDAQRAWKRSLVAKATGIENVELVTASPLAYRRRARLAWTHLPLNPKQIGGEPRGETKAERDGERLVQTVALIGYRSGRSRELVEPASCAILAPPLDTALALLRSIVAPSVVSDGEIRLSATIDDRVTIALDSRTAQPPSAYAACARLASDSRVAGVALRIGDGAPAIWGDVAEHTIGVDGVELLAPPFSFSQAHGEINAALVAHVVRLAETRDVSVLELYAGHGNITVALAPGARELVAIERDARAVAAGAANVKARGLSQARFVAGDAAALPKGPRVDVVVLDPPREGAKEALAAIVARRPARIVYVSCDTATLERDVRTLRGLGYVPDAAVALDMFPQTAHVESVVRLVATSEPSS